MIKDTQVAQFIATARLHLSLLPVIIDDSCLPSYKAPADLQHVVKTTVFLSDMADFAAMNEVYAEFFSQPFPARSAVAVKTLPKNALVEVECIAVK